MTTFAHTGKRITLVSLAAIALLIGVTSGVAYSQMGRTQISALPSDDIGALEASRKLRCIMPTAWRQGCGEQS